MTSQISHDLELLKLSPVSPHGFGVESRPYAPIHVELLARAEKLNLDHLLNVKHYFPIPGRTLPSAFVPSRTNRNPPVLYYGIPVSVNNLPVYALRTHEAKNDDPPIHMVLKGLAALRRACKRRVFTAFPKVTYDEDHNLMLGLYSNYDMDEKREDEETETALFDRVKEEFKLDKNLPAMWFFSLESEWDPARDQKDWDDILEFSARNPYSSDDEDEWEGPDPYTRFVYSDEEDSGEDATSEPC